ncbi:flagellar filament capping protein FliD [Halothiobacillus neapolitanus]|uniref:Flagellar hook-associated protein 2 n=1 Tax=Halothiobacillus neapolitanus (strain ATCC 23641 / DSM 15147 / CIP 104769 / NCIMB 8539 / c2) TaxID=555778 RepID=D0KYF4_HALNC|nr:flagellar filament capping protein FliD [Halothiobacillus neapolitanus]ACX95477.1 flagellar hook-associated 2 domain protein [Halothiobacillus neapolitanus c2]TDN65774.1 flagellar hook-associated protein 2 [Halothiobacillus neapolitanus]
MSTTVSTTSSTSPSGISFSGLGSGLDIQGIVTQLVNAEGAPQQQILTNRQTAFNTTLSALGQLKSSLSSIQTAVDAFQNLDTFRTRTATVSNSSILSASAIPGTALGTYQVEVDQLATAQKMASAGYASATSTVGSGTLNFTVGSGSFSVSVAATDTLTNIRDNINAATGNTGVQASIINVDNGSGGTVSKLVMTALNTGTSNGFTVTAVDSDGNNTDAVGLSALASNNLTQISAAQDSIIKIDGMQVTSASNSVSTAVTGLTLNLTQAQVGTSVAVTVGTDNSPITTALQTLVTNYNKYQSTNASLTSYDQTANQAGALLGDVTATGVNNALRSLMGQNYTTGSTTIQNLADIGIQVDKNGVMSLDTTKLNQALAADPNVVKTLLTDPTNGVSAKVDSVLNPYLQYNGVFDSRTASINSQLKTITTQQADLQARLNQYQTSLMAQFTAMDSYVAQMNQSMSFLSKLN